MTTSGALHRLLAGGTELRAESVDAFGDERFGRIHFHLRAQPRQPEQIGFRHAGMFDISENRHFQTLYFSEMFPHGAQIEKGLRGVFVHAVPRVEDAQAFTVLASR